MADVSNTSLDHQAMVDYWDKVDAVMGDADVMRTKVPLQAGNIWQWFWQLNETRPSNGMGISRLSNREFIAWLELSGEYVSREEWQVLKNMDAVFCRISNEEMAAVEKDVGSHQRP